jgi:hypothetical protein
MSLTSLKVAAGLWPLQVKQTDNRGNALTASGTTQAGALLVTAEYNEFSTGASGSGCVLPTPAQAGGLEHGDSLKIFNAGANALLVYPPVGGYIGASAINTAVSLAAGALGEFTVSLTALKWAQN